MLTDNLAALIVKTLTSTLPLLPPPFVEGMAGVADFLHEFVPIRRKEIEKNLALSNLQLDERQIPILSKRMYRHQLLNVLEFMRISTLQTATLQQRVSVEGIQHFHRALENGKGAILVTAHFGNWEYLGATLPLLGLPLHSMVRHQSGAFDQKINDLRCLSGNQVFDRNHSGRKILKILKSNEIVGILADQHTDNLGYKVPFLGRDCMATGAPVAFAIKSGAPLIPAFSIRTGFEKHQIRILPPIGLEITGDKERDIADGTMKYTRVIESMVREFPEQWFWFHKRWR